jgi:hypothetical protein
MPHSAGLVTRFSSAPPGCAANLSENPARQHGRRVTILGRHDISTAMYPALLIMVLAVFAFYPKLALWLLALVAALLLRRWW